MPKRYWYGVFRGQVLNVLPLNNEWNLKCRVSKTSRKHRYLMRLMEAHGLYWERIRRSESMSDDLILIIFTCLLKQHEGCFGRELVNFNRSHMTRTTPELAPPLQTFEQHQQEDVWPPRYDLECNGTIHGVSSVESGFEPRSLQPLSRDLTTKPPRPRHISL
ncbi:hypothetical protein AVEN_260337-1 [Araneus ventricosus]|uniref:Uncharacterized protein n=1 Tax=Araneus ventricosus TaxID=182803 RepID=A0A4Y2K4Y3_ARAVE|nr:hypothetical protein AVEN_260337-1 [Araneus ventricosus]